MLKLNYQVYTEDYAEAIKQILNEQKNKKLVACTEQTLSALDNRDFMVFNEKVIKAIITSILMPSNYLNVKNEYPVEKGYVDLALFPKDEMKPIMLIELRYCAPEAKYIKSSEFDDIVLVSKRQEAYNQLKKYQSAKEFVEKNVIKWILIFSKDQCVLNETVE